MLIISLRKARSFSLHLCHFFSTFRCYVRAVGDPKVSLGSNCTFESGVLLKATDGGSIELGARVSLGINVKIVAQAGRIVVGNDVHIGDGAIIVCRESIHIGDDSLIAEYVVIRDQDHETGTRPIRLAGFRTSPVRIGRDVWVGCKASILRGVGIGDGAVVGAHALVRNDVPAGMLAAGVPARVLRSVGGVE